MIRAARLKQALRVCWTAALFAGGPYLIFTVPMGGYLTVGCPEEPRLCVTGPLLIFGPVVIAFLTITMGLLVIGLPLSLALARQGRATPRNLAWIGGIVGGLLMALPFFFAVEWLNGILMMCPAGVIGGAIAGHQWGEVLERERDQPA